MIVTLSVKTDKGNKSTSKDVDKTIDLLVELEELISKKMKGCKSKAKAYCECKKRRYVFKQ